MVKRAAYSPRRLIVVMCWIPWNHLVTGVGYYYLTSIVVALGLAAALTSSAFREIHESNEGAPSPLFNWDGKVYLHIAETGYAYDAQRLSNIVYFPGYPLASRALARMSGAPQDIVLLCTAHLFLIGAFIVAAPYVAERCAEKAGAADFSLLAMGFFPTTFFFRMPYTEAMFVFVTALFLLGLQRQWPSVVLAAIAGLATATRAVGVALVPVLAWYVWRASAAHTKAARGAETVAVAAIGCWGLIAFMTFQTAEFGDPLLFAKTQWHYVFRGVSETSLWDKIIATATLEPLWAVYVPTRMDYWAAHDTHLSPVFSLQFANPIYFLAIVGLVIVGWRKKWLNDYEVILSAGLLLIPYVFKSYDNAMASFGRFSAVVLPAYLVMGHILARLGPAIAAALLALSAFFLGIYSALFAAGYRLI